MKGVGQGKSPTRSASFGNFHENVNIKEPLFGRLLLRSPDFY